MYNCENTLDYKHERDRLCDTKRKFCTKCPLFLEGCNISSVTKDSIKALQEWSDNNQEKPYTIFDEYCNRLGIIDESIKEGLFENLRDIQDEEISRSYLLCCHVLGLREGCKSHDRCFDCWQEAYHR